MVERNESDCLIFSGWFIGSLPLSCVLGIFVSVSSKPDHLPGNPWRFSHSRYPVFALVVGILNQAKFDSLFLNSNFFSLCYQESKGSYQRGCFVLLFAKTTIPIFDKKDHFLSFQ